MCNSCRGTGWIDVVDGEGVARVQRCDCWVKAHRFGDGVPAEFRSASLDNWGGTYRHALAAAKRMLRNIENPTGRDLYLCGSIGTGKTRLACSILNDHFCKRRAGTFRRVPWLLVQLQPSGGSDREYMWPVVTAPLLVLDDLGAERDTATDYTRRTLLALAEQRRYAGRRTIWTSNLTPSAVGDQMQDDRLMSRLVGWCDVVGMTGDDRRRVVA